MKHIVPLLLIFAFACKEKQPKPDLEGMYFPNSEWTSVTPSDVNWNSDSLPSLYTMLEANGTRAFIVLKNGRIVIEKYWGKNLLNNADFDVNSQWYWASAGKTLTAMLVGIAQQQGHLSLDDISSKYLGDHWSSLALNKEELITVRHHLTMTTGLDYTVANLDCTDSVCLQYKVDAGKQWYYHNAPYTLLEKVVSIATGINYNVYTDQSIESKIGMNGSWQKLDYNNVYFSTARDAARFGLLLLNGGHWDGVAVLDDQEYFNQMVNSSQNLNLSYGYLTWLNGKSSIIVPGIPSVFNYSLSPSAPTSLFAALGKNGQFIDVIPELDVVVIRMGENPDQSAVPILFHDKIWQMLYHVIPW